MNDLKWHKRFLNLAKTISTFSKDPSTQVGCVVVDNDRNLRTMGYNGFPRHVEDDCNRLNERETKLSMMVHAEANAISTCARLGIRTEGCTLYCTHLPCDNCAGLIIQAGISTVVVNEPDINFAGRWIKENASATIMFKEASIKLIEITYVPDYSWRDE